MTIDIYAIEAKARAATPGPWEWWTSNSYRRLTGADGKAGGVAHGFTHRDGVTDIAIREEDMAHIAAVSPNVVLELIARLRDAERVAAPIPGLDNSPGSIAMSERSLVNLLNLACARLPPPGLRQQAYLELQERLCGIENERRAKLTVPTAEDACSCDESLALQARVRELEERNASQARTIAVLDHMLADDPEFCSEPDAKLRMAKLKLGARLVERREFQPFDRGPEMDPARRFYFQLPGIEGTEGEGATPAEAILDAIGKASGDV
jgi:uncharacterized coiled-coil protein SlyX